MDSRPPEAIEIATYYVVSEALTNAAKHAHPSAVSVVVHLGAVVPDGEVQDRRAGGASLARGTGLIGLKDRAEALGGRLFLHSPAGTGTTLHAELPLDFGPNR